MEREERDLIMQAVAADRDKIPVDIFSVRYSVTVKLEDINDLPAFFSMVPPGEYSVTRYN